MALFRHLSAALALLAGLITSSLSARAETYNTCAGFIDTLPATISTQGVWCLRQDLSTAITSGNAITIDTNNVTIDCNDFKLGGLAAGVATNATGIYALNRLNATVRHCNIRGFYRGVYLFGGSGGGHVIEDNRFDGNTHTGLEVEGDGSVVRRNLVRDTGGSTFTTGDAHGIRTNSNVDVLDNAVSGVLPTATAGNATAYGIRTANIDYSSISGNRVRGLIPLGTGTARGIYNFSDDRASLDSNHVVGNASTGSLGLRCSSSNSSAKDNIVSGFVTAIVTCSDAGGNYDNP